MIRERSMLAFTSFVAVPRRAYYAPARRKTCQITSSPQNLLQSISGASLPLFSCKPRVFSTRQVHFAPVYMAQIQEGASPPADPKADTIFGKIIRKEIPAKVVFEDDKVLAFRDVNPQAPVHIVLVPKQFVRRMADVKSGEHDAIMGHLFCTAAEIARKEPGLEDGYRLVVNDGLAGGQSVYHLHIHILGGRQLGWPPG